MLDSKSTNVQPEKVKCTTDAEGNEHERRQTSSADGAEDFCLFVVIFCCFVNPFTLGLFRLSDFSFSSERISYSHTLHCEQGTLHFD